MIFIDDHPPPHVHVFGGGEAKVEIGDGGKRPFVVRAEDMSGAVQRRAVRVVAANASELLARWVEIHG